MTLEEVKTKLLGQFGQTAIVKEDATALRPTWQVATEQLQPMARFLHGLYFDHLACITGIDNGPQVGTMEVIYNLYSIPYNLHLTLKVETGRNAENEPLPRVPSLTPIWRAADWHEREIYDLLGIHFEGHPDLRRILMPADWEGHPLRKDYKLQETYHGIKTEY